jgi:hypothetical protein
LIDAQGSRYTAPTRKQTAIKIDEGSRRYVQTNGIGHSTTPRIDDVLEKLNCTTANDVFDSLKDILMAARSQNALRATYSATKIRNTMT